MVKPLIKRRRKIVQTLKGLLLEYKSPRHLAFAVALGIFIGASPLWGFHTFLALGFAFLFRLNKSAVVLATFISNPWFAPFLIFTSLETGSLLLHGHTSLLAFNEIKTLLAQPDWREVIEDYLVPYFWGAFLVASVLSVISYWVVLLLLKRNGGPAEIRDP